MVVNGSFITWGDFAKIYFNDFEHRKKVHDTVPELYVEG